MKNRFELAKDVFIDFVDLDDYIEIYNKGGSVMVKLIEMILKENLVTKKAIAKLMPPIELAGTILVATFMTIIVSVILEASWARPLARILLKDKTSNL